jgi:hypothetical protein
MMVTMNSTRIAERFNEFHHANPHVYKIIVRLAREYRQATGRVKCGMSLLMGRARWELSVSTSDEDPKLNNDYAAFYAREIMRNESDLRGFFNIRRSWADFELAA